jgi:pimeloyl-ACP methyl ester carboxylesterase
VCGGCTAGFTPEAMAKSLVPAALAIPVSTLVLWGMADSAFDNQRNLDGLAQYVPKLTIKTYANTSHWIAQEQPAAVAGDMLAFYQHL